MSPKALTSFQTFQHLTIELLTYSTINFNLIHLPLPDAPKLISMWLRSHNLSLKVCMFRLVSVSYENTRVKAASWLHFLSADTVSMSCCKTLLFCIGFTNDHLSLQMSSWCKLANEQLRSVSNVMLISVCQWSADISLPMSCWCYVGQWAAGISWPINSWCKLANM